MVTTQENGIIYWDGVEDVMIKVPESYKTKPGSNHRLYGLCGTFDGNKDNDFLSVSGTQSYSNVNDFVAQWKQNTCTESNLQPAYYAPSGHEAAIANAEKECSVIDSSVFSACHASIDRLPYKQMCMKDVVHCNYNMRSDCVCNSLSMYSRACQNIANVTLSWRSSSLCRKYCIKSVWLDASSRIVFPLALGLHCPGYYALMEKFNIHCLCFMYVSFFRLPKRISELF